MPRPDGKADHLGVVVLDEPATNQSDPTVLKLKFRMHGKESGRNNEEVSRTNLYSSIVLTDVERVQMNKQWRSAYLTFLCFCKPYFSNT